MAGTVGVDALRADNMDTTANVSGIGGGAGAGTEPDIYYQGVGAISRKVTGAGFYTSTGTNRDVTATGRETWLAKVALANFSGATLLELRVGSGTGAYYTYTVFSGAGGYPSAPGGFLLVPVDANIAGYRDGTTGSPTLTAVSYFGTYAEGPTSKAENLVLDAVDLVYGLYVTAGTGGSPAVFDDFRSYDQGTIGNRYGIVTASNGVFSILGQAVIGATSASGTLTTTATVFDDSSQTIVFPDGRFAAGWSGITVDLGNASTTCDWGSLTLVGRGNTTTTDTRPVLTVTGTSGAMTIDACAFSSWASFTLTSATTVTGTTFASSGAITLGGATLTGCTISESTGSSAVVTDDLDLLDGCSFVSSGTGHAVDLGTISATDTMGWDCTTTGYAGSDGSTGNETILVSVASGQTLTINVATGATTPTIYNTGAGTVSVVSGQVTTTITVVDIDTGSALQNVNVYLEADTGGPLTAGTVIIGTSTLTDVNGEVSDTRSLASDQPVIGRARRASAGFGTLYKTSPIVGTINSASGLDITVQMIKDE